MEDINRIKLVLVEKKRTSKWLSEQLGVHHLLFRNGVRTPPNLILVACWKWQNYWEWTLRNSWLVSIRNIIFFLMRRKTSFHKPC